MNQPSTWLAASLLLVTVVVSLAWWMYRTLSRRLERERGEAQQMAAVHRATIEALALAIDAKDQHARHHIRRMQVYATGVARALGMNEPEVEAVNTAALLHDIGKLAVPDHILAKPGPLTGEEFQKVRIHPHVGAEIIAAVPFPSPVAPLIRSHHERWDGKGYPAGLKGADIPLGARILYLVDYFDALTSDRPYHRAMPVETAVNLLKQESGKAFDPAVVDAFIRVMAALREDADRNIPVTDAPVSRRPASGSHAVATRVPDGVGSSVFDDIAHAHREIYALYQVAQTMGTSLGVADTMTVVSSKLMNLVPYSACALFLHNEESDALSCRFATGTDSELMQQLTLRTGQGLTGWVARNRRPLVNARPSADLEAAGSNLPTALQSALVCPLVYRDRFIGTLAVYHVTPSFYRDDHRRLLDRVCEQAAAVIHNAIVFEQTQEASLTDPLTGMPNTRYMFIHLSRELARAERLKAEVALIVLDLNDFKDINDNYGHHIGDRALRHVGQALRGAIRPYDVCVRYAGDEFIVVLAGCSREEAEHKRVELQQVIDGVMLEVRPGQRIAMSISAGAAVFPHDGDSYEALLAKADGRMYQEKSARKRDARRQILERAVNDDLPSAQSM